MITVRIPRYPKLVGQRVTVQGASPQQKGCYLATDALEVTIRNQ